VDLDCIGLGASCVELGGIGVGECGWEGELLGDGGKIVWNWTV
jgi:hypothetical protein